MNTCNDDHFLPNLAGKEVICCQRVCSMKVFGKPQRNLQEAVLLKAAYFSVLMFFWASNKIMEVSKNECLIKSYRTTSKALALHRAIPG